MTISETEEDEIRRHIQEIKEKRKKLESTQPRGAPSIKELTEQLRLARFRSELKEEEDKLQKTKEILKWEKRLRQASDVYEIFLVIEKAPEEVKEEAWEDFLKQGPDKNDLNLIISFCSEKYRKKAQAFLNELLEEKNNI